MTALLALGSALLIGAADFMGAFLSRRLPAARVATVNQWLGLLLAIPVAVVAGAERVTAGDVAWSLASGACVGVGLLWFYAAMARGPVTIAAPVTAVIGAVTPAVVGIARGERPGPLALAGLVLALVAIAIVSTAAGRSPESPAAGGRRSVLPLAIGAGLLFGGFYTFLAQPSESSGLWSMPLSRLAAGLVLLAIALRTTRGVRTGLPSLRTIAVIASFEVTATVALVLALQRGPVAVASVLASLYPVTTVLLAASVLGERLDRRQLGGVALALAAVVLVSTG